MSNAFVSPPASLRFMVKVLTRRQWRANAATAVQPHLLSDEVLLRIVQAASVERVWSLALTELLFVSVLIKGICHFPSKVVLLEILIFLFLAQIVASRLTRYRSIFVTDQRILVFDSGYLARNPTKRLLRELPPAEATEIPSKRWRRFVSMGEVLYFLGSSEYVRAGLVTPERIALSSQLCADEGNQRTDD